MKKIFVKRNLLTALGVMLICLPTRILYSENADSMAPSLAPVENRAPTNLDFSFRLHYS